MKKKLIAGILILIALFVGGYFVYTASVKESKNEVPSLNEMGIEPFEKGEVVPEVTLTDFDGNTYKLSDFRGQVVLLDFWAGWCPFCIEEMPILDNVDKTHGEVTVIGVHRTDTESKERGLSFAEDRGVEYLLVTDERGELYNAAGGFGMPVVVYIDQDGVVVNIKSGPKTEEEIKNQINKLTEVD